MFSKVNHVIYSSVPISIPNMKGLAQILFSKGHNSEKGHNLDMEKNMGQLYSSKEVLHQFIVFSF